MPASPEAIRSTLEKNLTTLEAVPSTVDFSFENHGSVCLLRPLTPSAVDWVNEHIGHGNGFQPYLPTVVNEPRYCSGILEGISLNGLTVRA